MLDRVLEEVEEQCREERIPMLGPDKAQLLASCVKKAKPALIVECGTAISYFGPWILRVLSLAFHIEIPKKEALIWNVTLHY